MTRTLKTAVFLLELFAGVAGCCLFVAIVTHTKLNNYELMLMFAGTFTFCFLYCAELLCLLHFKETSINIKGDKLRLLFLLFSVLVFYDLYGGVNFIPGPYQKLPFSVKIFFGDVSLFIYFLIKTIKLNDLRLHARKMAEQN